MAVIQTKAVKQVEQTKRRSFRGRSKLLALSCLTIAVMLVAAGCGGSGAPTGFDSEDGGDTVRNNFIEGCEVAVEASELSAAANRVCVCTYDEIVRESQTSEGITFAQFDEVDDDLREDINKLSEPTNDRVISKIRGYMRECITDNS